MAEMARVGRALATLFGVLGCREYEIQLTHPCTDGTSWLL